MPDACNTAVGFVVPGPLDAPTGGTRYDRRVVAELRAIGVAVEVLSLQGRFPDPGDRDLSNAKERIGALARSMPVIIDGLIYGALGAGASTLARDRPLLALVHHPLALETGLDAATATRLERSERQALTAARAIIVTSPATASLLATDYAVAPDRITVVLPGVDRPSEDDARYTPRSAAGPVRLLSVGSLIPRKGYLDLVAALALCGDLDWHAECVGSSSLDLAHAAVVADAIVAAGLSGRVTLTGALEETALRERYATADCFVLASHYEGYGMAYTEALAAGLPVIGTTGASEAIGDGGIQIAPGDVASLGQALRAVIADPEVRSNLRQRAVARARDLPTWRGAGLAIASLIAAIG